MRYFLKAVLAGLLATSAVSAANAETTSVRVVLLDMTSLMPSGYAPGQWHGQMGMMGPGTMGPGMMLQGMGGMMGKGMAGQGMPMHGMMSVRVTPDTATAGNVMFDVANLSRSVIHEMMIVKVDSPDALLPYDYGRWQVIESQVKVLGDTENIPPNGSKVIEANLSPGYYLLLCNVPGHFAGGMSTSFYVK